MVSSVETTMTAALLLPPFLVTGAGCRFRDCRGRRRRQQERRPRQRGVGGTEQRSGAEQSGIDRGKVPAREKVGFVGPVDVGVEGIGQRAGDDRVHVGVDDEIAAARHDRPGEDRHRPYRGTGTGPQRAARDQANLPAIARCIPGDQAQRILIGDRVRRQGKEQPREDDTEQKSRPFRPRPPSRYNHQRDTPRTLSCAVGRRARFPRGPPRHVPFRLSDAGLTLKVG